MINAPKTMLYSFGFTLSFIIILFPSVSLSWSLATAAKRFKGQTLNISVMIGYERNKILQEKLIPEFKEKTGIEVKISYVPYNDVLDEHQYLLSANSSKFDLLNVDNEWFPVYVDQLASIDKFLKDSLLKMPNFLVEDFIPELLEGYSWNGRVYCFPETFEAPILMVRKDLFEKAGFVDSKGNVVPPRNIKEYYEYAKKLTQDLDGDGKTDIYGTTLHGHRTGIFDEVISFYWGEGGEIFDAYLHPTLDNEILHKILSYYQKIYTEGYAPPESTNWELGEAATAFRLGKAAMSWNWAMVTPWILDKQKSLVYDKAIFVKLFKGLSEEQRYLREASTALCIPKHAKNKEAAFLFMQWISSQEVQKRYFREGYHVHPSRRSVLFSKEYSEVVPYANLQRDIVSTNSIRLCPKIRDYPAVDQIGAIQFQQVMIGKLTPEKATVNAMRNLTDFLQSRGYYDRPKKYDSFHTGIYP